MRLENLLKTLRALAPEHLAEPWDKVGLHVGDPGQNVRRAMLCIDLTEPVMAEAVAQKANLIVAYHPPIFKPLERLTTDDWKGRLILEAARRRIAIYSPHTALDAAEGGVNDWLADGVGAGNVQTITAAHTAEPSQFKLVTFIPPEYADALRAALSAAGAGVIGDYTACSFNLSGEGTFRGGSATKPAVGRPGRFERVNELRIEMLCPADRLAQVLAALRRVHPYEEPAFDLYPLAAPPADACVGQGRVVTLHRPVTLSRLVERIKQRLGAAHVELAAPRTRRRVQRVGLCAGAGGSLLQAAGDIDLFFTGEMRHHDVLDAVSRGVAVILAGHTQTERPYLPVYRQRLATETGKAVKWFVSRRDRAPGTRV